ncbi:MAG: hypothetical protein DMF68_03780 [Acidobacteria bacterium]|nr:MAG: hypothetical protein DMF68_03780 [Acidobacteriota bacterium]
MTSAGKPGRLSGAQPQVAGRAADGVVQPTLMGLLGGAALGTAYTLATAGVGWGVLAGLAIGSAVGHTVTDAYNYFTGGGQPLPVAAPAAAPPFNLDADALLELILSNHEDISQAIQTGAAWEIWKQVQLSIKLRQRGLAVVREASYGDGTSLDLLVRDANATTVAIELKVESATNAGRKLATDVRNDLSKINNYGAVAVNEKWVVGIGYSSAARSALSDISNGMGGIVEYGERGGIGVVVVRANQLF